MNTTRGLWKDDKTPKAGWKYLGVKDLEGKQYAKCTMCGQGGLRYVHYLEHPAFEETHAVGCVCAERMVKDPSRIQENEKMIRRRNITEIKNN